MQQKGDADDASGDMNTTRMVTGANVAYYLTMSEHDTQTKCKSEQIWSFTLNTLAC